MLGMGDIRSADGFIRPIHIVGASTTMDMDIDEARREEVTCAIDDLLSKVFWGKLFDIGNPFVFETDHGVLKDRRRKDHISFDKKIAHDQTVL